jgi:hypothetical protein
MPPPENLGDDTPKVDAALDSVLANSTNSVIWECGLQYIGKSTNMIMAHLDSISEVIGRTKIASIQTQCLHLLITPAPTPIKVQTRLEALLHSVDLDAKVRHQLAMYLHEGSENN